MIIFGFNNFGKIVAELDENRIINKSNPISCILGNESIKYFLFIRDSHLKQSALSQFWTLKKQNTVFIDFDFILISRLDIARISNFRLCGFDDFSSFLKKFFTYTDVKNFSAGEEVPTINFVGITNNLGMPNRGPVIQTQLKQMYFARDISNLKISFSDSILNPVNWNHVLNPQLANKIIPNLSIGPNILFKGNLDKIFLNKKIVSDSEWFKQILIERYQLEESQISVIEIYVTEDFYYTNPEDNENITLGFVGYYDNDDIKNFSSIPSICKKFPKIRFEVLSSRNKESFPSWLQEIKNLTFLNVPHKDVIHYMKYWNGYIGLSKRERGPAVLQELKTLGIPTICPLHTGYAEFSPSIGLNISPFKEHSKKDLDLFYMAIEDLINNNEKYKQRALDEKEIFWTEKKSTKIVSKKWENFLKKCVEEF